MSRRSRVQQASSGGVRCTCLEQAFSRARTGEEHQRLFVCSSEKCPIREVEQSAIDSFIELIGADTEDATSLEMVADHALQGCVGHGRTSKLPAKTGA